jgi:hypothetical protein
MKKMSKPKAMTFYVEGPDWEQSVSVDPTVCEDERAQLFEAATRAVETQCRRYFARSQEQSSQERGHGERLHLPCECGAAPTGGKSSGKFQEPVWPRPSVG